MRILITAVVLFFASYSFGQIAFFHLYTNGGDDNAEGIVQLEDSSYIVTGSSDNFPGGIGSQGFLMKIDSMGIPLWSQHYGGLESDQGKRVMYEPGFGLFMAGTTNSFGEGAYDFWLVKTDLNGTVEWEKSYGKESWERLYDAALTRDSGVFMVGETLSNPTNNSDMYIVRTDKNGDTLWTKTLGGLGPDGLRSVRPFDDSTFYVAGQTYIDDSLYSKAFIAKYHEDGTLIWKDTLGENGNYFFNDVYTDDSEVFCAGYTNGPSVDVNDIYYYRLQHDGTPIGPTTQGIAGDYKAHQVCTYGIAGNRFVGYTYFTSTSQPDGDDLAIGVYNYVFTWEDAVLNLGYLDQDIINDLIPTSDGGAIAVGQTSSEGIGVHHGYVAKIGPGPGDTGAPSYVAPHTTFGLVVGVEETEIEDYLSVYPNPTDGILNIRSESNDVISIEFLNSLGQVILIDELIGSTELHLSSFGSGVYYLKTSVSGISNVRKIIVK